MPRFLKTLLSGGPVLAFIFISLMAILTHGLLISQLGYYHDDWYMLWSGAARGPDSLPPLFALDRPFMGVIYSYTYRWFRDNPLAWHWATLAVRVAGAMAFYWIARLLWPKRKSLAVFLSMIFVIFPGFLAEPNAATKINHLIGYGAALYSIGFSLAAAKTRRRVWQVVYTLFALGLLAFYLWIYEYMIGLEVMRLALLFWLVWPGAGKRILAAGRRILLTYLPYLLVIGTFLYWRVFVFESTRNATDLRGLVGDYRSDLVGMALRLVFQVVKDFLSATVFAWFTQFYHLLVDADYPAILLALAVAVGAVLLSAGVWRLTRGTEMPGEEENGDSPYALIALGALSTLGAVLPVVLSNRFLDLMDAYKGYGLHPSAGVMILVLGGVLLLKPQFRRVALVGLIALSAFTQSLNIQRWATYWDLQKNMWWQLTWRAPDLSDDTLLMAYLPDGFVYQQDYEVWGPVNLIYRPGPWNFPPIQAEVLNRDTLFDVLLGKVTDPHVRDIFMPRNYQNLLLISQPTRQSCIHVIDNAMPAYAASERPMVREAGSYSHIERILTTGTAPTPPAIIFGHEPARDWCYFYQQAELARQNGDWQRIGTLYDQVVSQGLRPGDASEYFVFIEGLVNLGREDEASQFGGAAIRGNEALQYSLCSSLESAPNYPPGYAYDRIHEVVCTPEE